MGLLGQNKRGVEVVARSMKVVARARSEVNEVVARSMAALDSILYLKYERLRSCLQCRLGKSGCNDRDCSMFIEKSKREANSLSKVGRKHLWSSYR